MITNNEEKRQRGHYSYLLFNSRVSLKRTEKGYLHQSVENYFDKILYISSISIIFATEPQKCVLKDDTQALEEVVVVGFGSQKKADLTGAVSQVKMDEV